LQTSFGRRTSGGLVTPGVAETVAGLCVTVAVFLLAAWVWSWYETDVRPYAAASAAAATDPLPRLRTVRADDRAGVRRLQETTNLLGEAGTYLEAGRLVWARTTLERVLALDPGNADALALLARVDAAERHDAPG
jgi:hypothetical protein